MVKVEFSNREIQGLFEDWGFEKVGHNAGHVVLRHPEAPGAKVQICAPGRAKITPHDALKKGADIVGVPLGKFKRGPEKQRKTAWKVGIVDLDALDAKIQAAQERAEASTTEVMAATNGENGSKTSEPDLAGPEWRDTNLGPSRQVLAYLRSRPNKPIRNSTIAEATGIQSNLCGATLSTLARKHPDKVKRPERGVYLYDSSSEDLAVDTYYRDRIERRRQEVRQERQEQAATTFTLVTTDRYGRAVLKDAEGVVWVAIRVEPGYHGGA